MRPQAVLWAITLVATANSVWSSAQAVPAFARQTGQPCTGCHVGAFGPELTPFGRAFKIRGYAEGGGTGAVTDVPVSALFLTSYTNTSRGQTVPASEHYGNNGNFAMDQISLFLAGRLNEHVGALIQGTFNGISSQFYLDNSDIRVVTSTKAFGYDADIGLSLNNSPGLSDPYNSTYPFGYPFTSSALSVTPNAGTLLGGGFAGNSVGLNAYAFVNDHVYVDLGIYDTMAPGVLKVTGNSYGPGSETGVAPYARVAYEWDWGDNNAHIGTAVFHSRVNPIDQAEDGRSADGSYGHDKYTDVFLGSGYQLLRQNHAFTFEGHYVYEIQDLLGSSNPLNPAFASSQNNNNLEEARTTLTYFYLQTYGATLSWDKLWGKKNQTIYNNGEPDFGSVKGSPSSNSFMLEADYVPFGKDGSWAGPFVNLKIGLQYTIYTQFNGSSTNYDGFGRNASDNNTLYLFLWTAL